MVLQDGEIFANASDFSKWKPKKIYLTTATHINAHYLPFLQLLKPLCAPSPPLLLDEDHLKSGTEEIANASFCWRGVHAINLEWGAINLEWGAKHSSPIV